MNGAFDYSGSPFTYFLSGPNSNRLAHYLGQSALFNPPKPPKAVGWDDPM